MWSGCIGREVAKKQDELKFMALGKCWLTFDLMSCVTRTAEYRESASFITLEQEYFDDVNLKEAIEERYQKIKPSEKEQAKISNFSRRLSRVFDRMVSSKTALLVDYVSIGSYRLDTMLRGDNVIDYLLVLNDVINANSNIDNDEVAEDRLVHAICELSKSEFSSSSNLKVERLSSECVRVDYRNGTFQAVCYSIVIDDSGVNGAGEDGRESDVLDRACACEHSASLIAPTTRVLIRVVKDIFRRIDGFCYMNSWLADKIVIYCLTPRLAKEQRADTRDSATTTAINMDAMSNAFRRIFQLLASGIFLTGCLTPFEYAEKQDFLTDEQADMITLTSHWVNCLLIAGGYRLIMGIDEPIVDQYGNWIYRQMIFKLGREGAYVEEYDEGDLIKCEQEAEQQSENKQQHHTNNNQEAPTKREYTQEQEEEKVDIVHSKISIKQELTQPEENNIDAYDERTTREKTLPPQIQPKPAVAENEDVDFLLMEYLRRSKLRYANSNANLAGGSQLSGIQVSIPITTTEHSQRDPASRKRKKSNNVDDEQTKHDE